MPSAPYSRSPPISSPRLGSHVELSIDRKGHHLPILQNVLHSDEESRNDEVIAEPNVNDNGSHIFSTCVARVASLANPHTLAERAITLTFCVVGIYVSFLSYGILQERIYSKRYGPNREQFEHAWFLVGFQCICNGILAGLIVLCAKQKVTYVPPWSMVKITCTHIGSALMANWALTFMSYPAQSLAKSCKLIPVMLMRIVIVQARYSVREYCQVFLITSGITLFMFNQHHEHTGDDNNFHEGNSSWWGLLLCLISLACDGFTGPLQERIYKEHNPSAFELMLLLNFYAIVLVSFILMITNQFMTGLRFCQNYPEFVTEAVMFGCTSAIGQMIVLFGLKVFNSLVLVTITTTRKFATILLSVLLYRHDLSFFQWCGVSMVFSGLFLDMYAAYQKHRLVQKSEKAPNPSTVSFLSDATSTKAEREMDQHSHSNMVHSNNISSPTSLDGNSSSIVDFSDEEDSESAKLLSKRT